MASHVEALRRGRTRPSAHTRRPYRLITSEDPCKTLGQGEVRHYERLTDASVAFVKSPARTSSWCPMTAAKPGS